MSLNQALLASLISTLVSHRWPFLIETRLISRNGKLKNDSSKARNRARKSTSRCLKRQAASGSSSKGGKESSASCSSNFSTHDIKGDSTQIICKEKLRV
jgi:hypothetical protein